MWTLPPWSVVDANSTSNWRRILRSQIFFHRRFSGEPTQIMRRKFVEYLVLIVFIFVELLLSAHRIQNIGLRNPPQMRNARITSYSWGAGGLLEADSHVGLSEGPQHYVCPCQRFSSGNTLEDYNP
jgi:hypothetical protein